MTVQWASFNPFRLRRLGVGALVLAFATLLAIGFLVERSWQEFRISTQEAENTALMLRINANVLALMRDAETGQRGYLLTGRREYLDPYRKAMRETPDEIRQLRNAATGKPLQVRHVEDLDRLAREKLAELQRTIALRDSEGSRSALDLVETGRGRDLMEQIRRSSLAIETDERQRRLNASQSVQFHAREAELVTLVGIAILGLLMTGAFVANQSAAVQSEQLIFKLAEANRSLTEVQEQLRITLYSIADGVITTDSRGIVERMNQVGERLTGFKEREARGKGIEEVLRLPAVDGARHPVRCAVEDGRWRELDGQQHLVGHNGDVVPIHLSAAPIMDEERTLHGSILVFRDISEMKHSEERLRESAKLESLGVLAGGIAHDFNNLLTGILGSAGMLRDFIPPDSPGNEMVDVVEQAGERAAQLTRQMLAYSGRGQFVVSPLNLSREVEQIAALVRASIPKGVDLRLSLDANLPRMVADKAQMQQVVMNLVINAAEAVTPPLGMVEVSTAVTRLAPGHAMEAVGGGTLPPGKYVVLEVKDNGIGMDAATRARIFEPFFTTKFTGRGLGLAAVQGIVRGHRGTLEVHSEPGKGTSFRVWFPSESE